MTPLLITVLVCATLAFVVRTASVAMVARWDADRACHVAHQTAALAVEERRVAVLEREVTIKERQLADRPATEPMPSDLVDRCRMWEDPEAQENERVNLMNLYFELKDWDLVRRQLPALAPVLETEPWAPREVA